MKRILTNFSQRNIVYGLLLAVALFGAATYGLVAQPRAAGQFASIAGSAYTRSFVSDQAVLIKLSQSTVQNLTVITNSIVAGDHHSCLISNNNTAYCAGRNDSGQLGLGTTSLSEPLPTIEFGLAAGSKISQLAAGDTHTCALTTIGEVYCAGLNLRGQLGTGNTTNVSTPTIKFMLPTGILASSIHIALSDEDTCAIATTGDAYCAGRNQRGQLGRGTISSAAHPTPNVVFGVPAGLKVRSFGGGFEFNCAIASDNNMYCAGFNEHGQLGIGTIGVGTDDGSPNTAYMLTAGLTVKSATFGDFFSCVIASDNQVYCAGRNNYAQLGINSTVSQATAVGRFQLNAGLSAVKIGAGDTHVCALTSDREVYCAGRNNYGQIGNGIVIPGSNRPIPNSRFALPTGLKALDISVGDSHTCVFASDRQLYCAGLNISGELGIGNLISDSSPDTRFGLPAGLSAVDVLTNDFGTCVLASNNDTYCSGENEYGQMGIGTLVDVSTPTMPFSIP